MKRTKLSDRVLPDYTRGEEIMNMVTHIVGGSLGVAALVLCVVRAALSGDWLDITGAAVYGTSIITLYTISSVYHGLPPGMGKKVMQVIDHCTIYFLIAGSYTPVVLSALRPVYPQIAWGLLAAQWVLATLGATFTAIDLHRYRVFSMICYIGMGWGIILFLPQTIQVIGMLSFGLLLTGGIAYTIGAVLYGIGAKKHWMHSVFHIFVVIGTVFQFFAIFLAI
jgi:hemolysin III